MCHTDHNRTILNYALYKLSNSTNEEDVVVTEKYCSPVHFINQLT